MDDIFTKRPFAELPHATSALVYLHFPWCHTSHKGKLILQEWVAAYQPNVEIFLAEDEHHTEWSDWLNSECTRTNQSLDGSGWGSLLFVNKGNVVSWIKLVYMSNPETIQRYFELFNTSQPIQPFKNPSPPSNPTP